MAGVTKYPPSKFMPQPEALSAKPAPRGTPTCQSMLMVLGEYLRFARHGRSEHQGAESDGFEVFRCFHNRTIFCC